MTTFGITRSKNEDDIIEGSMRRMLRQVDHIIIGDNSTDDTRKILERLVDEGLPITLLDDYRRNVEQREVMTDYAQMAAWMGAEWVCPFDIDEVWFVPGGRIGDALLELPDAVCAVVASNVTHCCTDADDPDEPDPMTRMGWRDRNVLPLGKVACRARPDLTIDHGNHVAHFESRVDTVEGGLIEIRHFPYRSPEQFIKRVEGAWPTLRDSGLPESHGTHMWAYGRCLDEHGPDGLRSWFRDGMFFTDPASNPELVYDPCPGVV